MSACLVKNSRYVSLENQGGNVLLLKANIASHDFRVTAGSHRKFIAVVMKSAVVIRVDDTLNNRAMFKEIK